MFPIDVSFDSLGRQFIGIYNHGIRVGTHTEYHVKITDGQITGEQIS